MVSVRKPDEKPEESQDVSTEAIMACAQDLIDAVHAKDTKSAAEAIKSAFEILDAMPHVEGEHVEPHGYDAQNQKAAQE